MGAPVVAEMITNNRVTDRSQSFTYDQLNRISSAQTTATHASNPADCWGQAFGYDASGNWSNLLSIAGASSPYTGCTQQSLSVTVNANNQIVGDTYDAAGNLMTIPGTGGATYVYNAENQMTSTSNSSAAVSSLAAANNAFTMPEITPGSPPIRTRPTRNSTSTRTTWISSSRTRGRTRNLW